MIIVSHNKNKIVRIFDFDRQSTISHNESDITAAIVKVAKEYPDELVVWCHADWLDHLNSDVIRELFTHDRLLLSYSPEDNYFPNTIGYVEDSPFININKAVRYPTWQMRSLVGGIKASVLSEIANRLGKTPDFDYFLCSIAKLGMPAGLFCYSEPKLLKNPNKSISLPQADTIRLFQFVKQYYKSQWVFLLLLNLFLYKRKLPLFSFFRSLFYNQIQLPEDFEIETRKNIETNYIADQTIDVVIPTIGRKKYLYQVLCDLKAQKKQPDNVIIVEQNPVPNSVSELDFITEESWPFEIKHTFTNRPGACNARNIALQQVESKWIFFADDDIVLSENFISDAIAYMKENKAEAGIFACLQKGEVNKFLRISQTTIFGSGCSIIKNRYDKNIFFDRALEFGYGEDTEFGMRLRNLGTDVIYFPEPGMLHLKAPIGGFRIKPELAWQNETMLPKPAPTVMYFKLRYYTKEQLQGYKVSFFIKLLGNQKINTIIPFLRKFEKAWISSVKWANKLEKEKSSYQGIK